MAKHLKTQVLRLAPIFDSAMPLTQAQFSVLIEAIDWRRTIATPTPARQS